MPTAQTVQWRDGGNVKKGVVASDEGLGIEQSAHAGLEHRTGLEHTVLPLVS